MSEDLVWLVECHNSREADEIGRELDAAAIPFFKNNQNMAALFPGAADGVSGFGLGKIVVMVSSEHLERATEIAKRIIGSRDE